MTLRLVTETLHTDDDLPLRVDLRVDTERPPRATVVVAHGFKGFRRWGFFPFVGERLAAAGFATVVFDFSMNGIGDDPVEFDRLDLFERNLLSREVADLELVVDWLRKDADLPADVRSGRIGLLGHSRGTVAVCTVAADHADAVGALVTWNGVSRALRHTEGQLARWEEDGKMAFMNARTGQRMAMRWDYVIDAREHAARIEPIACARRMQTPHLIVHGDQDMAVPLAEAHDLRAGRDAGDGCELVEIPGGTHTFGAVHPFEGTTPQLDRALESTRAWFDRYLNQETP